MCVLKVRDAIADIVIALAAGAFWALAFEYPGMNIEQVIFNGCLKGVNNKILEQEEKKIQADLSNERYRETIK